MMNRAQRREQQKQARRQPKPVRLVTRRFPTIDQTYFVFRPIDKFLGQLATGEVWADKKGRLIHEDDDGEVYESIPAVRGFVAAFARLLKAHGMAIDLDPLIKMCNRLEAQMPITADLVRHSQSIIDRCREAFRHMQVDRIASLVRTTQIQLQMEA